MYIGMIHAYNAHYAFSGHQLASFLFTLCHFKELWEIAGILSLVWNVK